MTMTFNRWLWALEAAARYFEILNAAFEAEDPKIKDSVATTLMHVCADCETYDMTQLAAVCRAERGRLEEWAEAAIEGGSSGINIRVMLPSTMLDRRAFDEAEGTPEPDPGTTYFVEVGPGSDRPVASKATAYGWAEVPDQQGRAGAREGGEGEGGDRAGRGRGGGREAAEDQVPEDPGDQEGDR